MLDVWKRWIWQGRQLAGNEKILVATLPKPFEAWYTPFNAELTVFFGQGDKIWTE